jgi:hypothetical protein
MPAQHVVHRSARHVQLDTMTIQLRHRTLDQAILIRWSERGFPRTAKGMAGAIRVAMHVDDPTGRWCVWRLPGTTRRSHAGNDEQCAS